MPIANGIRALTLYPHFAWAIVNGRKSSEYRSRRTHYRGAILVHASCKAPDPFLPDGTPVPPNLPRGAILGAAEIVGCEGEYNDWEWLLANPRRFVHPIPCKGQLGLWVPRAVTVSCEGCNAEQAIESLTEGFTCRRCGRKNAAPLAGAVPVEQVPCNEWHIYCEHCNEPFDIDPKATRALCPFCNRWSEIEQ